MSNYLIDRYRTQFFYLTLLWCNIHLLEAVTSANWWRCCCCTCRGSSRKWPDGRTALWSKADGFSPAPPSSRAQTPPQSCWLWQRRSTACRGTVWPGGIWDYHTDTPTVHLWKKWYEFTTQSCCFTVQRGTCTSSWQKGVGVWVLQNYIFSRHNKPTLVNWISLLALLCSGDSSRLEWLIIKLFSSQCEQENKSLWWKRSL